MARFNPIQNSFVAGEASPRIEARDDLDQYFQSLRQSENGIVLPHGGFQRRSGTRFVAPTKGTGQVRLIPFVVSVVVAYVVELGDQYARFFINGQQVEDNNGNPLEITTPFKEDELRDVHFTQSADIMWMVHPNHFPRLLKRTAVGPPPTFVIEKVQFRDGHAPLRRPNPDLENPLRVTGTSGNPRTLVWRNTPDTGPLGNDDVGRAVRHNDGQNVGWYKITNVQSDTQAEADLVGGKDPVTGTLTSKKNDNPLQVETSATDHGLVQGEVIRFPSEQGSSNVLDEPFFIVGPNVLNSSGEIILNQFQINSFPDDQPVDGTSLTIGGGETWVRTPTDWALGMFADGEGPRTVTFHEGRLAYGGSKQEVDRVTLSVVNDFNNFDLTSGDLDDAARADKAIQRRVLSTQVNSVQWLQSADERLFIGTSGGEFLLRGENRDLLTPDGAQVVPMTARGSEHIQPPVIDNQVVFVQRNGTKLRRLGFDVQTDGLVATDISILAEHILDSGVFELAYQQDPDSVLWTLRGDGILVGWTIEAQQEVIGAHRHVVGGAWEGRESVVESVTTIPAPPGQNQDQVWFSIRRTIGGVTQRYIEFLEDQYKPNVNTASTDLELQGAIENAVFVDSSLSLDNPVEITGLTLGDPTFVQTSAAHNLSAGDTFRFRDIRGTSELNQVTAEVDGVVSSTEFSAKVDSSSFSPYKGGGTVRKEFSSFLGLDHLEGETVQVLADGAVHPDRTVSGGGVQLTRKASIVHIGLPFTYRLETQRFIGGGQLGTDQGQQARIQRVNVRFHDTLGAEIGVGPTPGEFEAPVFRRSSDRMDRAIPLFTGDREVPVNGGWSDVPTVHIKQEQPLPITVLGLMPRMESHER